VRKFEYKIVKKNTDNISDLKKINKLGQEGWEMVSNNLKTPYGDLFPAVFKRETNQKSK